MTLTIDAVYDGKVLRPIEPIDLKPNTWVRLVVETVEHPPVSFLDVAQSLALEGPPDWSTKLDEYLYGGKRLNGS